MTSTATERSRVIDEIQKDLAEGRISLGVAIRRLRVEVTGLKQNQFAKMCRISLRTLASIELGEGNPTLQSLNATLHPFGFEMGMIRRKSRR